MGHLRLSVDCLFINIHENSFNVCLPMCQRTSSGQEAICVCIFSLGLCMCVSMYVPRPWQRDRRPRGKRPKRMRTATRIAMATSSLVSTAMTRTEHSSWTLVKFNEGLVSAGDTLVFGSVCALRWSVHWTVPKRTLAWFGAFYHLSVLNWAINAGQKACFYLNNTSSEHTCHHQRVENVGSKILNVGNFDIWAAMSP